MPPIEVTYPAWFPEIASSLVTLAASRDLEAGDLNGDVDLAGFTLNVVALVGRQGSFKAIGPGVLTGGVAVTLAEEESIDVTVNGASFASNPKPGAFVKTL